MTSLACSLADGVLLMPFNFSPPTVTAHQYKEGKGSSKKVPNLLTEKPFTSK